MLKDLNYRPTASRELYSREETIRADPRVARPVGTLRADEQAAFYRTLLKAIHQPETQEQMPAHRMCLTCAHFEVSKNPKRSPHHSALLQMNMADTDLRLDCSVYEEADVATQKKS